MAHQLVIKKKSSQSTRLLLMLTIIGVAVICIASGYYYSHKDVKKLNQKISELSEENVQLQKSLSEIQQQANELSLENRATSVARDHLQSSVRTLQHDNATLHRELEFYKRIMSPEEIENGIQLSDFAIQQKDGEYSLITSLYQAGKHEVFQQGNIQFKVEVSKDGKTRWLSADQVKQRIGGSRKYTFRYFQHIENTITIDPSEKITQITLMVLKSGKVVIERTLSWEK